MNINYLIEVKGVMHAYENPQLLMINVIENEETSPKMWRREDDKFTIKYKPLNLAGLRILTNTSS